MQVVHIGIFLIIVFIVFVDIVCSIKLGGSKSTVRYLETNSWQFSVGSFQIAVDPVLYAPLDFGIPLLYTGKKRYIDGRAELNKLTEISDYVLLSQGLDDHAHTPTLKQLATSRPTLPYIAPPSALNTLLSCGIKRDCITLISPGETLNLKKGSDSLSITATTGAVVGPPWQAAENGYIIKLNNKSPSIYYEPHCMYDAGELSRYQVDYVISPIVSQELPQFTLVAGGDKAIKLAEILKAKAIIPMANGELEQTGLLSSIIKSQGSYDDVSNLLQQKKSKIQLMKVIPGVEVPLN